MDINAIEAFLDDPNLPDEVKAIKDNVWNIAKTNKDQKGNITLGGIQKLQTVLGEHSSLLDLYKTQEKQEEMGGIMMIPEITSQPHTDWKALEIALLKHRQYS